MYFFLGLEQRQPAPYEETKENAIPPTPGRGLIASGRIPTCLQSDEEDLDEDLEGSAEQSRHDQRLSSPPIGSPPGSGINTDISRQKSPSPLPSVHEEDMHDDVVSPEPVEEEQPEPEVTPEKQHRPEVAQPLQQQQPVAAIPNKDAVTDSMEESLALIEKLKQQQQQDPAQITASSKDEGYVR